MLDITKITTPQSCVRHSAPDAGSCSKLCRAILRHSLGLGNAYSIAAHDSHMNDLLFSSIFTSRRLLIRPLTLVTIAQVKHMLKPIKKVKSQVEQSPQQCETRSVRPSFRRPNGKLAILAAEVDIIPSFVCFPRICSAIDTSSPILHILHIGIDCPR